MVLIMFLILLAAFAAIGSVEWLKAFVTALKTKKLTEWLWPLVTLFISIIVSLAAAMIWPIIVKEDMVLKINILFIWPLLFFVTLGTIQLGYSIVIKTFLDLLGGLALRVNNVRRIDEPGTLPNSPPSP